MASDLARAVIEDLEAFIEAKIRAEIDPNIANHRDWYLNIMRDNAQEAIDDLLKSILFAPIDEFRLQ